MARYLVVGNLTTESPKLRVEAARVLAKDPDATFDVVVPRGDLPPAVVALSAVDAQTLRRERAIRLRRRLVSAGAREISIHLAAQEALDEIDAILREPGFRAVIVCTRRDLVRRWLRTDLPGLVSRRHPALKVRVITAPADFYEDRPLVRLIRRTAQLPKQSTAGLSKH
jgi:hypothetical protein